MSAKVRSESISEPLLSYHYWYFSSPQVVSQAEWLEARKALLVKEKELTRANDALTIERQQLPMVKLDKDYKFTGPLGSVSLRDLFNGREQLIVYHFMFDPEWDAGCIGCSFFGDHVPTLCHLKHKDTEFVVVSRAPLAKIEAFKKRMGWTFPWYSSAGSDFNYDFHATLDKSIRPVMYNYTTKEVPGGASKGGDVSALSVFFKQDDNVFHTYSTFARGIDKLLATSTLLDLTPLGRRDLPMGPGSYKYNDQYDEE